MKTRSLKAGDFLEVRGSLCFIHEHMPCASPDLRTGRGGTNKTENPWYNQKNALSCYTQRHCETGTSHGKLALHQLAVAKKRSKLASTITKPM